MENETTQDLLPQNRPNQGNGTQEGLELKSFKLGLHWFCLDQSSLLKVSLSWSLFFVLAVGSPIISHFLLLCSDCDKRHQRPYDALVQLSLSSFAAISFVSLSSWARKYGTRKFLFLDKLCDVSDKVRRGYAEELQKSMKLLCVFVLPCFALESAYRIWWYATGPSQIPYFGNMIVSDTIACVLQLMSWLYRTSIFILACIFYQLTCHLQILRLEDFAQVFKRKLNQFFALLLTTRTTTSVNIYEVGELALCSISMVTGLFICLRSATKITHRAQAITSLASKWHVCATINTFDDVDNETPTNQITSPQMYPAEVYWESDEEDGSDDLDNTKLVPVFAHTLSFQKRQALVNYLEHNRAGITVFGFMVDRTGIHTIFGIELALLLWLLNKTIVVILFIWEDGKDLLAIRIYVAWSSIVSIPMPIGSSSKEQQKIYRDWFNIADSDRDGRVTGNEATKFFALSKLSRQELKQIWAIADSKRQGFLGLKEFIVALQLISLAQAGHEITSDILKTGLEHISLPLIEGVDALATKKKDLTTNGAHGMNGSSQPQGLTSAKWFTSKPSKKIPASAVTSIVDGLKRLYIEKLKPLEATYRFNDFVSPSLTNSDFDAKPMVMLLGQYSTGKTTFIKHLLQCDYPGAHIGPEPTTDRFVVVMSGPDERSIPGNTIAVQADLPYGGLTTFGGAFLSKFECSQMPHPLLDQITFVDTPGVLSGEKQRTQRSYDFTGVISWFAAKCDLILLLFDPHKLDISDEFKRVISCLRGNDDKIRVVLNKAHQVDTQQLMRVYGALMWSLGKVLNTPEVVRVYIGSFNDKHNNEAGIDQLGQDLFEKEQDDLLKDLLDIPRKACDRRINEFVKRARAAKINAYIISHLKKEMPSMMGKAKAQQRLIDNLQDEFAKENGLLFVPKGQAQNAQAQMFSDPNMAMDMMKKNLSMIVPQTHFCLGQLFFSGFVEACRFAKIPFPLTQRFRSMLQNGIDLSAVDVSYVSSRSWYFLNLFGLRGLFSLILGEENATDDTQRMMQMSGFGFDPSKVLSQFDLHRVLQAEEVLQASDI
ncbi:EH domain-containing protein 1 [Hibiscus syriacus]|uniref:EH domain-containing protein 1 n=2 Tax=Magnoliopsida TaxID=3398 RepID=A0A6A3CJ18_HIBSY|nr:EH domain-containing protein 1 [Hibiscus syriacus]